MAQVPRDLRSERFRKMTWTPGWSKTWSTSRRIVNLNESPGKSPQLGVNWRIFFRRSPAWRAVSLPPTADLIWVFNVQSHKICPSLFSNSNLQKDRIELSVSRMVFWWYFPPCFPGSRLVYLPPRRYVVLQASIARKEKGQNNVCRIPQSATRALFEYESNLATSKT
jgi:hypothetical protein